MTLAQRILELLKTSSLSTPEIMDRLGPVTNKRSQVWANLSRLKKNGRIKSVVTRNRDAKGSRIIAFWKIV